MPFVFTDTLATPGNFATSGSANTEVNALYIKAAATRGCGFQAFYVIGKGAGLTAISGIAFRTRVYATASTSGSAAAKVPKDVNGPAANHTAFTGGTTGSSATNGVIFGCGAAGPGGWIAPNPDSIQILSAGTTASADVLSVSGTTSLNFELSAEVIE